MGGVACVYPRRATANVVRAFLRVDCTPEASHTHTHIHTHTEQIATNKKKNTIMSLSPRHVHVEMHVKMETCVHIML